MTPIATNSTPQNSLLASNLRISKKLRNKHWQVNNAYHCKVPCNAIPWAYFPLVLCFFVGALSHYFCLAHSFWSMCFVTNTYSVVVHHNRAVFKHPIKIHLMESVLGWLVPAVIVASCLYFCQPGYKFYFMDLMSAGPASSEMAYFAIALPLTVTLGVSLCLLWSIVWHIRKVWKT